MQNDRDTLPDLISAATCIRLTVAKTVTCYPEAYDPSLAAKRCFHLSRRTYIEPPFSAFFKQPRTLTIKNINSSKYH
ncbi:hypothetical protein PCANC_01761 [Puccinia coronata f. sp. avenae]|uniref:Uncharacterized protein n=1 Tax=Puccinia coronata f. sp. avenae TaxID=200324 RepID=A0A2N5W5E1_9BASI|nr:hypothetical protein PCANC_01761 [Puccinia coronata f. sp. avenae]